MSEIPYDEIRDLVTAGSDPQRGNHIRRAAEVVRKWLEQPPMKKHTVSVEIMVAVDSAGNYEALGATETDKTEADLLDELRMYNRHQQPAHVVRVRADVPLPSAIVVQGEVVK